MDQKKLGVLGGGQLGRMMVEAGNRLGIPITILDSGDSVPAKQVSSWSEHQDGSFKDYEQVVALKKKCDIITVEIEHIDTKALETIEAQFPGTVQPTSKCLKLIQDKYVQKVHLAQHNIPLPEFVELTSSEQVDQAVFKWGLPLMIKAKKLAYDGRGNFPIKTEAELPQIKSLIEKEPTNFYAERWVDFKSELAVMVVRSLDGKCKAYPVVETIQKDNICHVVVAPANVPQKVTQLTSKIAIEAIQSLPGAGIFGIELFLLKDGNVVLNEIAPRPHNSGHYTIEACHTSQYENHIRAVLDLPLGSTQLKVNCCAMVNLLGDSDDRATIVDSVSKSLLVEGATCHWYGKAGNRKGRKMGHVTLVANDPIQLRERLAQMLACLPDCNPELAAQYVKVNPEVAIIMGSDSDLPKMKAAATILEQFQVPFELTIVSAHRTPDRMLEFARGAHLRGVKVIIAAAGGAAHLPGMVAALTPLPVIGVPIALAHLDGVDSLHSIVQMPRGVPVATVAIDNSTNAALLAIRMLGVANPRYLDQMIHYQTQMRTTVENKIEKLSLQGWKDYQV